MHNQAVPQPTKENHEPPHTTFRQSRHQGPPVNTKPWQTDAVGGFPLDVHAPSGRLAIKVQKTADDAADAELAERVAAALQIVGDTPADVLKVMTASGVTLAALISELQMRRDLLSRVVAASTDDDAWTSLRGGIATGMEAARHAKPH